MNRDQREGVAMFLLACPTHRPTCVGEVAFSLLALVRIQELVVAKARCNIV